MSFMLTTDQIKSRIKTVTRRIGWWSLKPGDVICAVEKGMGLKAGQKINRLAVLRVRSTRAEPLKAIVDDECYGTEECALEGFGMHSELKHPRQFVDFFCKSHKGCTPDSQVNRIEFEYLDQVV